MKNRTKLKRFFATLRMTSKRTAFILAELPEAGQYGSHQELSAMAKVEPEARQHGSKQAAFTLAEVPEARQHGSKQVAFTLAEVLITLGIIGIVAAMTIPTLMQKYQEKSVEAKLSKFYSAFNQALLLSEAENGDRLSWYKNSNSYETDPETGEIIPETCEVTKWWLTYIDPYMPTTAIKYDNSGLPIFYFKDGSALKAVHKTAMTDWYFYTLEPDKCETFGNKGGGICRFAFLYIPAVYHSSSVLTKYMSYGMDTYKFAWDGERESLFTGVTKYSSASYLGCNPQRGTTTYCSAIIQLNNWKIPKDYPFKVKG